MPGIDLRLGHYSFEEFIKTVHHQMQLETDKKLISKMISRNVNGEKKSFYKSSATFFKSFILSKLYALATTQYSGVVTNLGNINLTRGINKWIDKFILILSPPNKYLQFDWLA